MQAPLSFWAIAAFLIGITLGSFLNAVIYRLPRGLSLLEPRHSMCPACRKSLSAVDLVPLLSFLALGRRCRQCKAPISWRYFWVELLTGLLFVAITVHYGGPRRAADWVALLCFAAALIPVFFIDLETFHIPDSLTLLLFFVAVGRDAWGIAQHEPGHALLWGWLPPSLLGAAAGGLLFGAVRVGGWLWKGVEAMGLGDVLLGRDIGAMLVSVAAPVGGVLQTVRLLPVWLLLSCFSGIAVGGVLILIRRRGAAQQAESGQAPDGAEAEAGGLAAQLMEVGWCLILGDLYAYLLHLMGRIPVEPMEDDFQPAPTAIPFGPFLAIGLVATLFVGEPITTAYANYAFRRQPNPSIGTRLSGRSSKTQAASRTLKSGATAWRQGTPVATGRSC